MVDTYIHATNVRVPDFAKLEIRPPRGMNVMERNIYVLVRMYDMDTLCEKEPEKLKNLYKEIKTIDHSTSDRRMDNIYSDHVIPNKYRDIQGYVERANGKHETAMGVNGDYLDNTRVSLTQNNERRSTTHTERNAVLLNQMYDYAFPLETFGPFMKKYFAKIYMLTHKNLEAERTKTVGIRVRVVDVINTINGMIKQIIIAFLTETTTRGVYIIQDQILTPPCLHTEYYRTVQCDKGTETYSIVNEDRIENMKMQLVVGCTVLIVNNNDNRVFVTSTDFSIADSVPEGYSTEKEKEIEIIALRRDTAEGNINTNRHIIEQTDKRYKLRVDTKMNVGDVLIIPNVDVLFGDTFTVSSAYNKASLTYKGMPIEAYLAENPDHYPVLTDTKDLQDTLYKAIVGSVHNVYSAKEEAGDGEEIRKKKTERKTVLDTYVKHIKQMHNNGTIRVRPFMALHVVATANNIEGGSKGFFLTVTNNKCVNNVREVYFNIPEQYIPFGNRIVTYGDDLDQDIMLIEKYDMVTEKSKMNMSMIHTEIKHNFRKDEAIGIRTLLDAVLSDKKGKPTDSLRDSVLKQIDRNLRSVDSLKHPCCKLTQIESKKMEDKLNEVKGVIGKMTEPIDESYIEATLTEIEYISRTITERMEIYNTHIAINSNRLKETGIVSDAIAYKLKKEEREEYKIGNDVPEYDGKKLLSKLNKLNTDHAMECEMKYKSAIDSIERELASSDILKAKYTICKNRARTEPEEHAPSTLK